MNILHDIYQGFGENALSILCGIFLVLILCLYMKGESKKVPLDQRHFWSSENPIKEDAEEYLNRGYLKDSMGRSFAFSYNQVLQEKDLIAFVGMTVRGFCRGLGKTLYVPMIDGEYAAFDAFIVDGGDDASLEVGEVGTLITNTPLDIKNLKLQGMIVEVIPGTMPEYGNAEIEEDKPKHFRDENEGVIEIM